MKCSSGHRGPLGAIENLRTLGPEGLDQTWRAQFGSGSRHDQFYLPPQPRSVLTPL
jgi:hypothetical protein